MYPPLWPQLLLQAVLIALNAFFAAAEVALLSLDEASARRLAEEGGREGPRLLRLAQSPSRFLSSVRLGITLTGFLGAAFAAEHFSGRLGAWLAARVPLSAGAAHTIAVAVIAVLLACLTLVLGELVPKRAAMQHPERALRAVCGAVSLLSALLHPLIWLLTVCADGVLRLLHIDPGAQPEKVSEEGIRRLVDIGEEHGAIETDEKEMIENIFEFNNMTAEDVMVHRTDMVLLWAEDTVEEIQRTIETSGLSRFPVYEEDADDIIGILNTRDWLLNDRRPAPKPIRELLRPAYFVPESVRTDALFRDMQSRKVHLAIVVDEYGGTAGLVTMEDLLEEIVGNIYDEFDPQEAQEIIPLGEDRWRVAGSAELEEVAEALGVAFPEDEESETLSGLIFAQLPMVPEDGSHPEVEVHGLRIRVETLADRRVEWALVSRLPSGSEAAPAPEREHPR